MTRIIAGTARGRRLVTPPGDSTRPTTDRVREAVFSALASWLGAASAADLGPLAFLDLYAGSGAVGLEAASRGATSTLVEKNPRVAQLIRRNAADAGLSTTVVAAGVENIMATVASSPFDVIWADPPYALEADRLAEIMADARANGWLASDGLIVLERSARTDAPQLADATDAWVNHYGETQLCFYRFDGRVEKEDR